MEQVLEKNVAVEEQVVEQAVVEAKAEETVETKERKLVLKADESKELLETGSIYITRDLRVTILVELHDKDGEAISTMIEEYDRVIVKRPEPKKVLKGVTELQEGDLVAIGDGKIYKVQANEADKLTAKAPGAKTAIEIAHSQVIQFIQVSPRA